MNMITSKFAHKKLIFLAPMEGITDRVYRKVAVKYMPMDVVCTEFVRLSGERFNPKSARDAIEFFDDVTLSVQLMGDNPKLFAETVPYFVDQGVQIIDLNLGCPSSKVNRKGCGAAMLLDWRLLKEVVHSIRKHCNVLFSCKMRAGWDDTSKAIDISKILANEGIDFLTVHPRTRVQGYEGNANWDLIREIKETLSIPVIGNGDVFSSSDAKNILNHTQCNGIMMGRGVLRNPFLLKDIADNLGEEREIRHNSYVSFYNDYMDEMLSEGRQERAVLSKMKEHFNHFCKHIDNGTDVWNVVKRLDSLENLRKILGDVCASRS